MPGRGDRPGDGVHDDPHARVQLRNAAVTQLRVAWASYNLQYAEGILAEPSIELATDARVRLGSWEKDLRRLTISERHVFEDSWTDVLATLRHEMAHQYADEVLGATDEGPHGPTFRRACETLRADPAARAVLTGPPESAAEGLLGRLRKLLALGRSPNRHEAEAALRKANDLMQEHRLERADIEGRGGSVGDPERSFGIASVGPIRKRHAAWRAVLANLIAAHFEVQVLWVHAYDAARGAEGRVLQLYGRRDRLAFARYVHDWIAESGLMERMWAADRKAQGVRGNRDRQSFYEGVVRGFRDTLDAAAGARARAERECAGEAAAPAADVGGDGGVAAGVGYDVAAREPDWLARERRALADFVRWHHPRVRTRRVGGRAAGAAAFRRGRERGRGLELRRPLEGGGGDVPRLPG